MSISTPAQSNDNQLPQVSRCTGAQFVARGPWLVARGSWLVARGSWLVTRGLPTSPRPHAPTSPRSVVLPLPSLVLRCSGASLHWCSGALASRFTGDGNPPLHWCAVATSIPLHWCSVATGIALHWYVASLAFSCSKHPASLVFSCYRYPASLVLSRPASLVLGLHCRGPWLVARGSWLVARGLWLVARGLPTSPRPHVPPSPRPPLPSIPARFFSATAVALADLEDPVALLASFSAYPTRQSNSAYRTFNLDPLPGISQFCLPCGRVDGCISVSTPPFISISAFTTQFNDTASLFVHFNFNSHYAFQYHSQSFPFRPLLSFQ